MTDDTLHFGDRRFRTRGEVDGVRGPVVVIDVLRAFSTAAYVLAGGAAGIVLVDSVEDALDYRAAHPGAVALGESGGQLVAGFDLGNSPARAARADLEGRLVVQRTTAGTRGVIAALRAQCDAGAPVQLWCAALVNASATAAAFTGADAPSDPPIYVVSGWAPQFPGAGLDDLAVARYIEALRLGEQPDAAAVAREVAESQEAGRTAALVPQHADPDDVAFATDVNRFNFAMPVMMIDGYPTLAPPHAARGDAAD